MITLLYGRTGTGKTAWMTGEIEHLLDAGKSVIYLCPEQDAVNAEGRLTGRLLGKVPTENLEVLNFGRLPEYVFRKFGHLSDAELGEGGRKLLLHRALSVAAPHLHEYGKTDADASMIGKLLSAITEFKMFCITPAALEEAAAALGEGGAGGRLRRKLDDFAVLYALYEELLHGQYRDAQDALTRLYDMLDGEAAAFFAGKYVYLDGFNGYTAQQYRIIQRIMEQAETTVISLACDFGGEPEWMLRRVYETEKHLYRLLAKSGKPHRTVALHENKRAQNEVLRFLWKNLWQVGGTEKTEAQGIVRVFSCKDLFSEAESVALDIRRQIARGRRYREITVILRDVDRYEGILDVIFEKYGIPCYMAKRGAVRAKPLIRYLHTLFSVYADSYRRQDVIGLLKTGLTGIDSEDAFLYENYITTWNLSGDRLRAGEDWTMHPLGFREELTDYDLSVLTRVNLVREQLDALLTPFFDRLAAYPTAEVREIAVWLYEHLEAAGIPAALEESAARAREYGAPAEALETEQLWRVFVDSLDTLVTVSGDFVCRPADFLALYDLLTSELDIGSIPARSDEVVIGDASLLRPDDASVVYLMGANEGVFPQNPTEDSLFSDYEKDILSGVGVTLSENSADRLRDEFFHFFMAACAAKENLIVTYPCADTAGRALHPSIGVERMFAMFTDCKAENPMLLPAEEHLYTEESGLELLAYRKDTPFGKALDDYFQNKAAEDALLARKLRAIRQPMVQRKNRLSAETVAALFPGNTLAMTQSRLERYVLCHFSYFCDYVLKLKEQRRVEFNTSDIGSFIHYVLEGFMARYSAEEDKSAYQDDAYLNAVVGELLNAYLRGVCHMDNPDFQPKRLSHLFGRLLRTSVSVVKNLMHEFEQSDFVPRDFELPVGADDGTALPALQILSPDGTKIRLYGKIDRVDTYEKDGKTYLRVVDYKTYIKRFSLDDVAMGLNMQMLLYLFSVWKMGGRRYRGELLPAGILYMSAAPGETVLNVIPAEEEAEALAERGMKRSGLFIDDKEVLNAMEHGLGGRYIPVRLNQNGSFRSDAPVETLERFGTLLHEVEGTVCAIVNEMKGGNADAIPISKTDPAAGRDPCAYCTKKPACRSVL